MDTNLWAGPNNGDWTDAADWSASLVPGAGTDATIAADGAYIVTITTSVSADSLTLSAAGALLQDSGQLALPNPGSTLALTAGTFALSGTITGGTLSADAGVFDWQGGTLDGVTYDGALAVTGSLHILDGLTATGADGMGPGSIDIAASGALAFDDTEVLDNVTVTLGSGAGLYVDDSYADYQANGYQYTNLTLILGGNATLDLVGDGATIGDTGYTDATIVNQGVIAVGGQGAPVSATIDPAEFVNDGTITVGAGADLTLSGGMFVNAAGGSIDVQSGGTLTLYSDWTNQGSITVEAGGTLDLGGAVTSADLAAIDFEGGALEIDGSLISLGNTLAVGAGEPIAALLLTGTIRGGTVEDDGSGVSFGGGVLDGVTYDGEIELPPLPDYIEVADGLTLHAVDGTSPGTIALGTYNDLLFDDTQTFDNAAILFQGDYDGIGESESFATYQADGYQSAAETLTLGSHLKLDVSGTDDELYNAGYDNSIAAIINDGTIIVEAGAQLIIETTSFTNAGTIILDPGGTLELDVPVTAADLAGLDAPGGTLDLDGTLDNTGATLAVGPGSAIGALVLNGTILNGTIQDSGSGLVAQGGTLDGVTYDGALEVTGSLHILDGLTATGADGTGPGSIEIAASGALAFDDTEVLDNVTVTLGTPGGYGGGLYVDDSYADYQANGYQYTNLTLILGGNATLDLVGEGATIGNTGYTDGTIVNQGVIAVGDQGQSIRTQIDPAEFVNDGTITVASGADLTIFDGVFVNAAGGSIDVQSGGVLELYSDWTNQGSITVEAGATLDLAGTVTSADLAAIDFAGGTLLIDGSLVNIGNTLAVGAGEPIPTLILNGTISGGTVEDQGSGIIFAVGMLDGVTYDGEIDLTPQYSTLEVADGLTVYAADGTSPGTIALGSYSQLSFDDSQTIDNATILFTGYGAELSENVSYAAYQAAGYQYIAETLTLGANLTIDVSGVGSVFGDDGFFGSGAIVNDGTIIVESGADLVLALAGFTNAGTIILEPNGTLDLGQGLGVTTADLAEIDAPGGTLDIQGTLDNTGATLAVGPGSAIGALVLNGTILNGTIQDSGSGLVAQGGTLDGVTYDGALEVTGTLHVLDGLTATGADGTGPGSIDIAASGALVFDDTEVLDNVTVTLGTPGGYGGGLYVDGSYADYQANGYQYTNPTLILGGNATLDLVGNDTSIGETGFADATVINQGVIAVGGQGQPTSALIIPAEFVNQGMVSVEAGADLYIFEGVFVNDAGGSIDVQSGGTLTLYSDWSNQGSITVEAGGTLVLGSGVANVDLSTIDFAGGALEIDGSLVNIGNTLTVGAGDPIAALLLTGAISGGTIQDSGSDVTIQDGTLDGVTYDGLLTLSDYSVDDDGYLALHVLDGLTVAGADGTGAGSVSLGVDSQLYFDNTETFDNAVLTLGGYGNQIEIEISYAAYVASGYQYIEQTLTLGANLVLDNTGADNVIGSTGYGGGALVNDGAIDVLAGELSIATTGFINDGTIDIGSGARFSIQPASFVNAGSIIVEAGGTLDLSGRFTQLALGNIAFAGVLQVDGTLDNTDATLTVGPGGLFPSLVLAGTILNGIVQDAGSGIVFDGGTLDGVTYDGEIDLTPSFSSVTIADGLTLTGTDGTGPGTIALGEYGALAFDDTQSFDNATVLLSGFESGLSDFVTYATYLASGSQYSTQTLTLGAGVTVDMIGTGAYIGGVAAYYNGYVNGFGYQAVINDGTINAESSGSSEIGPLNFINDGDIAVSNGDILYDQSDSFTNDGDITIGSGSTLITVSGSFLNDVGGTIDVQSGGLLELETSWSNLGTIVVEAGGLLVLGGSFTTAMLGSITGDDTAVDIEGTLDNTGTTLAVGPGEPIGVLDLTGTIVGGTIVDTSSGSHFQSGTLDGVTFDGVIDLIPGYSSQLRIADGLTLTGTDGTGAGTATLGAGIGIVFDDTQTFDNATVTLSGDDSGLSIYATYSAYVANGYQYTSPTLTLGAGLTVDITGSNAFLGDYGSYNSVYGNGYGYPGIVNDGAINAAANGTTAIYVQNFTNAGTITVSNGDTLADEAASFTNDGTITIGSGSALVAETGTFLNNAGGSIDIQSGGELALAQGWSNLGTITVEAGATLELSGTVTTAQLEAIRFYGGTLILTGSLDNSGATLAVVPGGDFDLTQGATGGGVLEIDAGATLELGGGFAGTIGFTGADATLVLDAPGDFTGTLHGLAYGDVLDLAGQVVTQAGIVGSDIVLTTSDSQTHSYAFDSIPSPTGFSIVSDHQGGTEVVLGASGLSITGTRAAQATTDQMAIDPFAHVTIAETGSVMETATVTLSTTADGTLSHLGGGSYDTTTGVYTVSGSAADVTTALDGLVFTPIGFQVAPGASVTTGFDLSVSSSSGATASDDTTSVVATAAAVWNIVAGQTLEIPGASHGQTIDFQGTAGLLVLDQPALADLTISGFTSGDHIDLAGISPAATPVLSGGTLSIGALHLGFAGDYTGQVFALVAAADGDAELTVATPITASGRQVVNLAGGDSNVSASGYANRITGTGTGDTVVTVTSGLNNSVHLGDGNTVVTTGANTASSSITLGDGTNQVNLGGTLQTVKLGNGTNSVAMSGSNNTITAGNGPDSVTGGTGNSSVTLGGGTDSVALGGWVNSVTVGDGDDSIDAGAGSATIHLGQGNDTVVLHGRNNVVTGGNGTDSVTGGGLADTVSLGNGDDTVALGGLLNVITLGDGHNTVSAGSGQGSVTVGGGANSITLAGSNNVVVGGNGADSVTGTGSYQDSVTLGDGADTVHLDGDHNTIHLGNGADSITLGGQGNNVTAGNGGVSVTGGGAGNNHVSVGTGGNSVQLTGWGNSVSIGGGTSTVDAGLGSSTIQVAGGDVSLTLHGRADMVFLHNAAQASIIDGSAGLKLGIDSGNVVASITGFGASSGAVLDLAGAGFTSVAQVLAALHSDGHGGTALALGGTGSVEFQNLAPSALHAGNFAVV